MQKTLVALEVPAIGESFEVMIPPQLSIRELSACLAQAVEELTEGRYHASGNEFLCAGERGELLQEAACAADYGIENGERLLLI